MRYTSRGPLALTGVLAPVASVAVAWAVSAATDRMFLPIIAGHVGDEPPSLVFLALPVTATVAVGRGLGHSRRTLWLVGFLAAAWTIVLAWIVWIAWLVVVCGIQDNRCFD
jgi:hypothetical protein